MLVVDFTLSQEKTPLILMTLKNELIQKISTGRI